MRGEGSRPSAASAARIAWRSRVRLPAPAKAASNRPSGFSARRSRASAPGRSLIVSSRPTETARSTLAGASVGNCSSSARRTSSPRSSSLSPSQGSALSSTARAKGRATRSSRSSNSSAARRCSQKASSLPAPARARRSRPSRASKGRVGAAVMRAPIAEPGRAPTSVRPRTACPDSDAISAVAFLPAERKIAGTPLAAMRRNDHWRIAWPSRPRPIKAPKCR